MTLFLILNAEAERRETEMDEPLRPLTSLKWPYIPEESAYPDPLKRDDPKVVQLPQYEAIGNSLLFVHNVTNESHHLDQPPPPPFGKHFPNIQTSSRSSAR